MAIQVEYSDGTKQWLPGGDFKVPVRFQAVPEGCTIISMTDDERVHEWRRWRDVWGQSREFILESYSVDISKREAA